MNAREQEALATLQDEGVEIESWFSLSLDADDFLLCYVRADSIAKAASHLSTFNLTATWHMELIYGGVPEAHPT